MNQGKHRGLAEPIIAIEWENQLTPYKVKFPKYFFNEKLQSECEFQKFLSPIYAMTSQMTVRTGVLINRFYKPTIEVVFLSPQYPLAPHSHHPPLA